MDNPKYIVCENAACECYSFCNEKEIFCLEIFNNYFFFSTYKEVIEWRSENNANEDGILYTKDGYRINESFFKKVCNKKIQCMYCGKSLELKNIKYKRIFNKRFYGYVSPLRTYCNDTQCYENDQNWYDYGITKNV